MSKFVKRIQEIIGNKKPKDNQSEIDRIEKEVDDGQTDDPVKVQIAQKAKQKRRQILNDLQSEAEGDDFVPRKGPEKGGQFEPANKDDFAQQPEVEPEAEPTPMTTEGETFYVNLARKSLFVDLDNVNLTDAEREVITQDVEPENAKEVAKILRKIVVDYGLSENFDSKIDSVWEDLELQDLRSKLSIEDLKKNSRVVVLVPGSFKPPHKGHYEMVKQYSEMYPQGHVHVLISAPSAKSERRTKDGKLVTPAASKQIFELYARPLNNVTISVSEYPSPVTAAFETLKTLDPGTTAVLGASKKDNDWKRWTSAQSWAEKEGLEINIIDPAQSAVDVTLKPTGEPYSASNIRDNFDNFEKIKADIPEHVDPVEIKEIFDSL